MGIRACWHIVIALMAASAFAGDFGWWDDRKPQAAGEAGWTPSSITNTILVWLESYETGDTQRTGNSVTNWVSKVGTNSYSQTTSAKYPTWMNPGIWFDGGDSLGSTGLGAVAQPHTVILVAVRTNDTPYTGVYYGGAATYYGLNETGISPTFYNRWYYGTVVNPFSWTLNKPIIAQSLANGAASTVYTNGVSCGTFNPGANAMAAGTWYIGSETGAAQYFNGTIYAIFIIQGGLSTTDRQSFDTYLATRYGITL